MTLRRTGVVRWYVDYHINETRTRKKAGETIHCLLVFVDKEASEATASHSP